MKQYWYLATLGLTFFSLLSIGCNSEQTPTPPPKVSLDITPNRTEDEMAASDPWFRKLTDTGIDFVHQSLSLIHI